MVKKEPNIVLDDPIGEFFKQVNIFEYKSPADSFTIDDFYKVLGYACIYKSLGDRVNEIAGEEITISIIRNSYPKELFKTLISSGVKIENAYPGIYYMIGNILFPIQILIHQLK